MKKILLFVLIFSFVVFAANSAYCGPMEKLARGIKNTLTFPLEIPKGVIDEYKESGPIEGIGLGAFKGVSNAGVKLLWGIYETLTFIIPVPENYEPMFTDKK